MKISNKLYNFIKYCCAVALPAINTAILALAQVFGWNWGDTVSQVLVIANTLLAALFCISIAGYNATVKTEGNLVEIGDSDDDEVDTEVEDTEEEDEEEDEETK